MRLLHARKANTSPHKIAFSTTLFCAAILVLMFHTTNILNLLWNAALRVICTTNIDIKRYAPLLLSEHTAAYFGTVIPLVLWNKNSHYSLIWFMCEKAQSLRNEVDPKSVTVKRAALLTLFQPNAIIAYFTRRNALLNVEHAFWFSILRSILTHPLPTHNIHNANKLFFMICFFAIVPRRREKKEEENIIKSWIMRQ